MAWIFILLKYYFCFSQNILDLENQCWSKLHQKKKIREDKHTHTHTHTHIGNVEGEVEILCHIIENKAKCIGNAIVLPEML